MNPETIDYPYESVEDVLNFAFAMEAKRVYSQGLSDGVGGGDNMFDRIAEGMMLRSTCLRAAGYMGQRVIAARYTTPTEDLVKRKEDDIKILGQWLHSQTKRPVWMLTDAVRDWTGLFSHHDQTWWSRELNKTPKTIYRWWKSKDPKDDSAHHILNEALEIALTRISIELRNAEIIP